MKALLVVFVLLAAGIVGLGFYRGWFSFASDSADAKSNITLTLDKEKLEADRKAAAKSVRGLAPKAKEKTAEDTDGR